MANRRYKPVKFGFLNTAQDSTDIAESESPNATNLDPDELALGALKHQDFTGEGSLKDFTETTMAGRRFFIGDENSADNGYTSYAQGQGFDSDLSSWIELPLTQADGLKAHVIAFDFYLTTPPSGSSENVIRTISGALTAHTIKVTVENQNELTFTFYDGVTTQAMTLVDPITTAQWYRVVLVHSTEVDKGYAAYVNGLLVDEQVGNTIVVGASGPLILGNSTDSLMVFRLRNLLIARGYATSPSKYDGTLRSLGFEGDVYQTIISSRDGSGADNRQNITMTKTGTPTFSSPEDSVAAGKVMFELDNSTRSSAFRACTQYDSANTGDDGRQCDRYLPFGEGTFVGFNITLERAALSGETSRTLFTFEDSGAIGTPTGFYVALKKALTDDYFELHIALKDGSFNTVVPRSMFVPGDSVYICAIVYDDSSETLTRRVGEMYVDGKQVFRTVKNIGDWVLRNVSTLRPIVMNTNYTVSTGTYSLRTSFRDIVIGNLKADADVNKLSSWVGENSLIEQHVDVLLSAPDGSFDNNEQGFSASSAVGKVPPTVYTPVQVTGLPQISDVVAESDGPIKPRKLTVTYANGLELDDGVGTLPTGFSIRERDGLAYNGPSELQINIASILTRATTAGYYFEIEVGYDGGETKRQGNDNGAIGLRHNLIMALDDTVSHPFAKDTTGWTLSVKGPVLLDGEYKYRAVGVRFSDTDPKVEIESRPNDPVDIQVRNISPDGLRVGNSVPSIVMPPASPGYPDFVDRVDLYRKDPDTDDYVKIAEHSGRAEYSYKDNNIITDLPRIEFLKTDKDETFSKINDAIGNTSGNYFMLFNKDNRLWTVPSDRKDLLLYSRENDWWGWKRENSFSFNGDIRDVVAIRDIAVVNGESTLVVFTSQGIYHIVGSGVESSPYVRVPMFGGDGSSNIDTYAGSALPFNGSIFFLAKSSDGGYETGAYGQKVYQYDLQQLAELSGRIKKTPTLDGDTNELEFASLLGGDKYILKKLTNGTCLVYHKDARGWLTYSSTAAQDWVWESKKFDRQALERGTIADSSRFKIDYKTQNANELTLEFTIYARGGTSTKTVTLPNSGGSRKVLENMLPANMGEQWSFKLTGDPNAEVYNMWFS